MPPCFPSFFFTSRVVRSGGANCAYVAKNPEKPFRVIPGGRIACGSAFQSPAITGELFQNQNLPALIWGRRATFIPFLRKPSLASDAAAYDGILVGGQKGRSFFLRGRILVRQPSLLE